MIITNQVVNIIDGDTFGKVTESKINASKLQKLYGMLSGLYKNIYASILREYVSNAVDSHREIKSEEPVVVKLNWDRQLNSGNITIIDKGTGMSPEVMETIYFNYLDSTKENSNDVHGAFGIGSKSALAYHHTFFINTIVNGIEYKYMFSKQANGIPAGELLSESSTTESNGTTIIIPVKTREDLRLFYDNAKKQFLYFNNVYVECDEFYYNNDYKVFENDLLFYNTSNSYITELHITLGNACYQLNYNELGISRIDIPIAVKFDIGELMPTPSREDIIYSKHSIEVINNKIKKALTWIEDEYNKNIRLDLSIKEYESISKNYNYLLLNNEIALSLSNEASKSNSSIALYKPSIKNFVKDALKEDDIRQFKFLGYELQGRIISNLGSNIKTNYVSTYRYKFKREFYALINENSSSVYPLYRFNINDLPAFILWDENDVSDPLKNKYINYSYKKSTHFLVRAKYSKNDYKEFVEALTIIYNNDRALAISKLRHLLKLADEYVQATCMKYSDIEVPEWFVDEYNKEKEVEKLRRTELSKIESEKAAEEKKVNYEYIKYDVWKSGYIKISDIKKIAHNIIYVEKADRKYAKELNNLLNKTYGTNVFAVITIAKSHMKQFKNDPTIMSMDDFLNKPNKIATKLAFMYKLQKCTINFSEKVDKYFFSDNYFKNIIHTTIYNERNLLYSLRSKLPSVDSTYFLHNVVKKVDDRNDYNKFGIDINYYTNLMNKHELYDKKISTFLESIIGYYSTSGISKITLSRFLIKALELSNIPVNNNMYIKLK